MSANDLSDEEKAVIKQIKTFAEELQSDDTSQRRRTLQILNKTLFQTKHSNSLYQEAFTIVNFSLIKGMRDKSEANREMSIEIVRNFITDFDVTDYHLAYIFPVLVERLGSPELVEESEELRLELINLLSTILNKHNKVNSLIHFLKDIVQILCQSLFDKYPKAREQSCKCIIDLAEALPKHFHLQCDSLVLPLIKSFTHQHHRIRYIAVKAMGVIILNSRSGTVIETAMNPLAERLFDQIALIRQVVAQVAGQLLTEYKDRYSHFHRIIPLMITGLCDEVPDTRDLVQEIWDKAGEQYERENEKDLKDLLDYPSEAPNGYPEDIKRPRLGCRVLVQRHVSKMLSAVCVELHSWQEDVRVRCAQLLCIIILHCEEYIMQSFPTLLPTMFDVCQRDEGGSVCSNMMTAAKYIGLFLPTNAWWDIMMPLLNNAPTVGQLRVLRSMLLGTPQDEFILIKSQYANFLFTHTVRCNSRKSAYLYELTKCCELLLPYEDTHNKLFGTLITIIGCCNVRNTKDSYIDVLQVSKMIMGCMNNAEQYLDLILNELRIFQTDISIDRCILNILLTDWGNGLMRHLPYLEQLVIRALDSNYDPEAILVTIEALSLFFQYDYIAEAFSIGDKAVEISHFATEISKSTLVPMLVWQAGRAAEAIRISAASCLMHVIKYVSVDLITDDDDLSFILSTLVSLVEDCSWISRFCACKVINHFGELLIGDEARQRRWANAAVNNLLKRLDDPNADVRFAAMECLCVILYEPNLLEPPNLRHLVDTVLYHIDNKDEVFRLAALRVLKTVRRSDWTYLDQKLKSDMHLYRNTEDCEELLEFLHSDEQM